MKSLLSSLLMFSALVATANAAEDVTSLRKSGFEIVGIIPSSAGPGIFLKKGDELIACFVAETPSSKDISTRYCKPVK